LDKAGQTDDHIPRICLPQDPLTVHCKAIHNEKQSTASGPLAGLPSLSLTTKCSWMHLVAVS